jgi:maltose alpha-D-glucosyltransferase/alpha-amylase
LAGAPTLSRAADRGPRRCRPPRRFWRGPGVADRGWTIAGTGQSRIEPPRRTGNENRDDQSCRDECPGNHHPQSAGRYYALDGQNLADQPAVDANVQDSPNDSDDGNNGYHGNGGHDDCGRDNCGHDDDHNPRDYGPDRLDDHCSVRLTAAPVEPWHHNAVFYSLSVEAFMDSDGDGVGDLSGLRARLDYLESLGVDALWLAPTYPTQNRDDGYDITDYYGVAERLGTSGDFAELLFEADGRGIRVLLDMVVNHTSNRHPWFLGSRASNESPYRNWYVWSRKRPRATRAGVVFPGVQRSTWTYDRQARSWYFHRFYDFEPDLNLENPRVREEIHRIVSYWLRLGVAGFRLDAVPFLLEKPQPEGGTAQLHFEYLRELREVVQWRRGDAILLGEANIVPRDDDHYFADGDGLHMMFNFWVNQHLFASIATADARPLASALAATRRIPAGAQWAHFLRNHDELDLGRLEPSTRDAVFARFAPEPSMQLYGRGIRRRLAPMLGDQRRLEFAYSLLFSLPGAPVLRYGEEIGMGENLRLKERDAIRTPMQWSDKRNAGFSTSEQLVRSVIDTGPYAFMAVNVDEQLRRPDSLLRWMIQMIRIRKECPEIGAGEWRNLPTRDRHVLAMLYTRGGSAVLCVHNFDEEAREIGLDLKMLSDGDRLRSLFGSGQSYGPGGRHRLRLEPFGYDWYRVG